MHKPPALAPGARVALVAPASPFDRTRFDRGVAELRALGFEPVFDERVFDRRGYLAGDAATRAAAFLDAWRDPTVAALVAVRGGYGSMQILPWLDRAMLGATPKVFVGASDLTALLTFLTLHCEVVSFHGPMVAGGLGRGPEGYHRASFLRVLTCAAPLGECAPPGLEVLRPGEAAGILVGGTLTMLAASLGTPYAFLPPEGCLLFFDEVRERPYRLDRLLTQLHLAGILARAAGIVIGELVGCDEPDGRLQGRAVVRQWLAEFPGPVLYGFPSGHTTRAAWTVPFGVRARIIADSRPRLVVEEAAVA